jgi:transposase
MNIKRVGIDLAKQVFQVHGVDTWQGYYERQTSTLRSHITQNFERRFDETKAIVIPVVQLSLQLLDCKT